MSSFDDRLMRIEARLNQVERLLEGMATRSGWSGAANKQSFPVPQASDAGPSVDGRPQNPRVAPRSSSVAASTVGANIATEHNSSVTNVLGWTGATALVLAAVYLIRLAIDSGWLTPTRQLALAVLGGFILIGLGLWLRKSNREYASLLPAGGIVIFFMSIYGAHIYYHLITAQMAGGAVVLVCLGALWLGSIFESQLYGLFAVVGSYSAPFLLPNLRNSTTDLIIYFSAWSILFCVYSIWAGKRRIYVLAAYMALLGFEAIWKLTAPAEWIAALIFQLVQFVLFAVGAAMYSIKRASPMDKNTALAHLPILLIFYVLQYGLLNMHLPSLAPWIATGSAVFLVLCYLVVRHYLQRTPEAGAMLVSAYAALVLFHAGYMESVPAEWAPWVAFLLLPLLGVYLYLRGAEASVTWPIKLAVGLVFAINYLRIIANAHLGDVPGRDALALLYAAELYVGYYLTRNISSLSEWRIPLLYAAHISVMAGAVHIFDGRFAVSLTWGVLAIACLVASLSNQDKALGKSSLLVFAASAVKVLLYDLSGAAPLVRIACLLVLGVTLYAGGWLYRKVDALN
jgi:uncharacterized membrane protein